MMTAATSRMRAKSVDAAKRPALTGSAMADGFNVFDVAPPRVERLDFGRVNVQPQDLHAGARELERQGQADITQTDNGYFHGCCFFLFILIN